MSAAMGNFVNYFSLLTLLIVSTVLAPFAQAGVELRPSWVKEGLRVRPNTSVLTSLQYNGPDMRPELSKLSAKKTYDSTAAAGMRQGFRDQFGGFEARRARGTLTIADQYEWDRQGREYSDGLKESLKKANYNRNIEKFRSAARQDGNLNRPVPKAVIGTAVFLTSYEPAAVELGKIGRLEARTDLTDQRAELSVASVFFNGSFRYRGGALKETLDPNYDQERYHFSIARDLPILGISSSFYYASTSNVMGATLVRPLSAQWKMEFDSIHPATMIADVPASKPAGDTVKLLYNVSF